jgi:hypothetical protein
MFASGLSRVGVGADRRSSGRGALKRVLVMALCTGALGGCEVSETDEVLSDEALAPPNLVLAYTGTPLAGSDVTLTVALPAAVSGKRTYFITTTAGQGTGIGACPSLLNGECLDVAQPMNLLGPVNSVSGTSTYDLTLGTGLIGDTVWVQAVVVHNGVGYKTNVISFEVEDPSGGQLTLANCGESYGSGLPTFYSTYFACVDATVANGTVTLWTDGLPPHETPYYASTDPNDVAWDARGGTHFQNPGTIAAQDFEINIPANPVAKGITINAAMVDNTMNTNTNEYSGGGVGVALNGVLIFAAMAAPGDDLVEEQYTFDLYEGHPAGSTYHYHFETPGPLEVLEDRGFATTSVPGAAEVELYGIMCDGTVVMGCTELDGSEPNDSNFDAQNGHVHSISDGTTTHFTNRYHTHVCPDLWPNYPFFPEIAYYSEAPCPVLGPP